MSAFHARCGTALRWKAALDDELIPGLMPWCDTCDRPAAVGEVVGDIADIPIHPADVNSLMNLDKKMENRH